MEFTVMNHPNFLIFYSSLQLICYNPERPYLSERSSTSNCVSASQKQMPQNVPFYISTRLKYEIVSNPIQNTNILKYLGKE